ncbi:MAG: aspartate ammonia-lyase [Weeksellaceae bacterium]|nr:aspartate ammonia-lyase [Weeksellaceae bacterium]
MSEFRQEADLLGYLDVPAKALYGVQTQRAIENFQITGHCIGDYPELVQALGYVKWAAAKTNYELNLIPEDIYQAIAEASKELTEGQWTDMFPTDPIQGGAGTSVNMNANEVIANRALEILGKNRGEYETVSPNDHANLSQSTNDAYPTAVKLALLLMQKKFSKELVLLIESFRKKGVEFENVLKMGRTQLQDAVPMTLGQEFEAFAVTLAEDVDRLEANAKLFLEINMGGTAIGTGINAPKAFGKVCADNLAELTGMPFVSAANFVEATPDLGAFVLFSSTLKRLAVKLSKICNDLRLLSSGPRAGLNEINLPPMQPGSSIMPGKVNPVIPELMNQVCFKVFGNDLTITFAAEAGQLQLNVMEPVVSQSLTESLLFLERAMKTLREKCIDGITANEEHCRHMVLNSIGIVTALNPHIGYKNSSKVAKEALASGRSVYDLVLEMDLLTREQLDDILNPEKMF